ncbi:hypothetical protein GXP67_24745 [Rhodocytophaga rosea]|uniref:Uncharacterized protein n=1 Tax=Rhodocytophaga rosea TaxID=2704465 RepID=A0A6C0GNW7_9BACT|nr:hypothetical protein [Rhodocytophaga rosea]QHT69627.1 hypothetical protein GXP67_24745 [Rhodocytophaga rosea]
MSEILSKSGDSTVHNYGYAKGRLNLDIELFDLDVRVKLGIQTDTIIFDPFLDTTTIKPLLAYMMVKELGPLLKTQHGIYVPDNDFGKFMKEFRSGLSLAYGRKASKIKYIFYLTGGVDLIICLISKMENISIIEMSNT